MRYEDMVRRVCGEDWKTVNPQEKAGGIGVACVLAFIRGNVKPSIQDFSNFLGVEDSEIVFPYTRLSRVGVFSQRFNAKKDPLLTNNFGSDESQRAWGHIAGISSGYIGV